MPRPPKAQENKLKELAEFIVQQITTRYQNNVIKSLNQSTINKFADAQQGNFAKIALSLSSRVRKSILNQLSDERISKTVRNILSTVNDRNANQIYDRIENAVGINAKELLSTEGLTSDINAYIQETVNWVKKLRDDTLEIYTVNSVRAMMLGNGIDGLTETLDNLSKEQLKRSGFIARQQISTFNSVLNKVRSLNLGIRRAIWRTSSDERVRAADKDRDGKEFDLNKGCYSSIDGLWLLPGIGYGCRCEYYMIIESEDED